MHRTSISFHATAFSRTQASLLVIVTPPPINDFTGRPSLQARCVANTVVLQSTTDASIQTHVCVARKYHTPTCLCWAREQEPKV